MRERRGWTARAAAAARLAVVVCGCSAESGPDVPDSARPLPVTRFLRANGSILSLDAPSEQPAPTWLVLRVVAGWCGPCRWSAAHTLELIPAELRDQVQVLDVLLAGQDNAVPEEQDATAWSTLSDGVATIVTDADFQLRSLFPERAPLPLLALVERSSLNVLEVFSNPAPEQMARALASGAARRAGNRPPPQPVPFLEDDRFTRNEWGLIAGMALPAAAPPDPSNAVADDPRAAALGKTLFFERRLSPREVSCSSCHQPELLFTDGKETPPEGAGAGERNAPSTLLAADQHVQLWDGRADSSWMQALAPIESPVEFASSRLYAAHALYNHHRAEYEALFGPLPPLDDAARFPSSGAPGDASWAALTEADRESVNRAYVGIGKAIAAYERSVRPVPNALDAYAGGQRDALTPQEKDGLQAFFTAGCAQCHYGPRLTDESFHNLRFPTGRHDRGADPGRAGGIAPLILSEFNRAGRFSDDASTFTPPREGRTSLGAFKTPGLRGVGFTLPYGHGGSYWGLTSVLEAIRQGGLPPESRFAAGEADPFLPEFDPALIPPLVSFLTSLHLEVEP